MTTPLPPSASHLYVNLFGLFCSIVTLFFIQAFNPQMDILLISVLAMISCLLPILLLETFWLKVQERGTTGIRLAPLREEVDMERVAIKVVGLVGTLWFLAFLYWVLPEYDSPQYTRFWDLLILGLPPLVLLSIPYFWWMDRRMKEPDDAYLHAGLLVLLQWDEVDIALVGRHIRNWLVKAFFLPLMFLYTGGNAQHIVQFNLENIHNFRDFFNYANNLIFYGDLIFAAVGYCMTFRFLDSHIRSSEPTFRGWVVAVMCYAPLWQTLFYGKYFAYDDGLFWGDWLGHSMPLYVLWGSAILALECIYALATVCLGYRFSNLTYRGLITSGPYRYTKHPAYVTKNLSWWLISIPFISHAGFAEGVKNCALLCGVNLIYYLRAKTEENHLSRYPEYVTYALMMNTRSIFAPVAAALPFLKYQVPDASLPALATEDKV